MGVTTISGEVTFCARGDRMKGFAGAPEGFAARPRAARVRVGPDGRILIPAGLRRAAGLEPGATVVVSLDGESLRVETSLAQLRRVQALLAPLKRPGIDEVEVFLSEKRAEALRE